MMIQKCCQIKRRPSPLREEGLATCVTTPDRTLVLGGWGSFSSMEIWAHVNAIYTTHATQKYYPIQRKNTFWESCFIERRGVTSYKIGAVFLQWKSLPHTASAHAAFFTDQHFLKVFGAFFDIACSSPNLFAQELKSWWPWDLWVEDRVGWGFQWFVGDYHLPYFVVTCVCIERVLFRQEFIQQLRGACFWIVV